MTTKSDRTANDVETLRAALGALPAPSARPKLILLSGLPGSGKTYLATRLAPRLGVVVLTSDVCRRQLVKKPSYHWRESRRLFAALHRLAAELLRDNISVILDATYLEASGRAPVYEIADTLGVPLTIFQVVAQEEIIKVRLAARAVDGSDASEADWRVYQRLKRTVQPVSRQHRIIDGAGATDAIIAIMEATINSEG